MSVGNATGFTWDPANTGNGGTIDPGSGAWDLTSVFWNTGSGNVAWTQTSTNSALNGAIFAGADGTYAVTVGTTQVAATNITFNNSGYTLSGSSIYLTGGGQSSTITVAANKAATINSTITGDNAQQTFTVNSGGTLNLGGNLSTIQTILNGGGTIDLMGNWSPNLFWGKNITFDQKGGTTNTVGGTMFVGYSGNTYYTVEGGATLNDNVGNVALCRGGSTGSVTIKSGGTVNIGTSSQPRFLAFSTYDANGGEHGMVDVQGGTLNVGSGTLTNQITFLTAGAISGQTATLTIEGGVANVQGMTFGSASGSYSGGTATVALTGGSLYLGSLGITEGSAHANDNVTFSGGLVGALTNWSSAMNIDLGSGGGPVTFQAADASGVSNNITLSGILSDSQGFIKSGTGVLTLGGANTYGGATVISAGTVALIGSGTLGSSTNVSLATGAVLDVSGLSSTTFTLNNGATLNASGTGTGPTAATILGNASGTVDLGTDNITLNYDGSDPALYVSSGTLQLEGNQWTVNAATPLPSVGTYVIAHVASGNIVASGSPTVAGTAVTGAAAHIAFSGGDVQLVVTSVGTPVTVSGLTANNKIYDSTTAATINTNGCTLSGVAPGDVGNVYLVTNSYTATFDTANVGVGKTVTVSGLSLGGSAASSYYVQQPIILSANITNASTTLTLSCANTNIPVGWPYVFLASLASTGWVPTSGVVTFTTNGVILGTSTLNAAGIATLTMSLVPGTYTVTAGYPGDTNVYGSTNTLTVALGTSSSGGIMWDANTGIAGAQDGSGDWGTAPVNWWNGTADIQWNSADAIFGGGTDGAYTINLTNNVNANSLTFNNSGYTIAGTGAITLGANVTVAANKTATINCNIPGANNAKTWMVNSNGVLNVGGNITGMQPTFQGSGTYYFSGNNAPSVFNIKSTVYQIAGSMTPSVYSFIGYSGSGNFGAYIITNSSLTMNANQSAGDLSVARGGNTAMLVIQNGASVAFSPAVSYVHNLNIASSDNNSNNHGYLDVQGGALAMGSGSVLCAINLMTAGGGTNESAIMTQEGGSINAWGGIVFGSGNTYVAPCTNSYTMTGGSLYLASAGLVRGGNHPSSSTVTVSGGTVGALQNWSTAIPVTLGTANGNVTFQCADNAGNSWNILLSGGLSGAGGLNKSGNGSLTLGGTINYSGTTLVSNGTLNVPAAAMPVSGAVTLDGSSGTPTVSISVTGAGQYWSIGDLNYASGTPTADFQFDSISPSIATAPIQVAGNVNFVVTPNVNIGGSAIAVGTYPLIQYTGTVSGTPPTAVTLPGALSASGYITNMASAKTIALVVTSSSFNPAISWRVGSGIWDINTTANWQKGGNPVSYIDGDAVLFDDTASGPSPITVTLNTMVNPWIVTADNTTNSYTIAGTGSIGGGATLTMLGNGVLTLAGVNTYSGGTVLNSGQLNINNGGNDSGGTAIGTGTLTVKAGTVIDNTSGSNVTLQAFVPEIWDGSFDYIGSSNNLNMGAGSITINQNMTLTVNSNAFTVDGSISDNGNNYSLTKAGSGTLTLGSANTIGKGITLASGALNLGSGSSVGSGTFEIDSGAIDNVSGSDITLSSGAVTWGGNFIYVGSSNNLDFGAATVLFGANVTLTVENNTVTTEGMLSSGNDVLTKNGSGTLTISGSTADSGLPLIVNEGRVNLDKSSGWAINLGGTPDVAGLTVNSNSLVVITGTSQDQIRDSVSGFPMPVRLLNGGALDLNGQTETVDTILMTNGVVRNGMASSYSALTVDGTNVINLGGENCGFDVPSGDAELDIHSVITGRGSLLKTGAGEVDVYSNATYTGSTTINAGTLALYYPSLATNSAVSVTFGAVLNMKFTGTNTIGSLTINGVNYSPGVYSSSTDPSYLQGSGSLLVQSYIATNPTNIIFSVTGNSLSLDWPADHLGWILQVQTNALNVGLGTNWVDVPGSGSTTSTNITVDQSTPTMFFRLRSPQ